MKPIKLCMQAFGPFAKYHEVDFRSVNNAPLFGFYGATGSGKTSILDAICFALFGKSSGGEREPETLRSDYATVEEDSFVSLIFSVGEKCYFIHRIPEYEKIKRKGVGTTWQKHEAFLFEVATQDIDSVTINENPGRLIAEKKITQVMEKVIDILGYNAQQFRQVVMLPQGKFREFLTSNSKSRSEILRQLFEVSLFEKLEWALKQKSKSLNENLKAISDQKDGVLQASGLESLAVLQEETSVKIKQQEEVLVKIKSADNTWKSLLKDLENAGKIKENFVLYNQVVAGLKVLELQQEDVTEQEQKLAMSKKAASLTIFSQKKSQAENEKKKSHDFFLKMVEQGKTLKQRHSELNRVFLLSEERQSERDHYEVEISQAKQYVGILLEQEPFRLDLEKIQSEKKLEKQSVDEVSRELKEVESKQKDVTNLQQHLIAQEFQVKGLAAELSVLTMQIEQYQALEDKRDEVKKNEKLLAQQVKNLMLAKQKFEATDQDFKTIEPLYFLARAAHFAQELKEGQPCPVCGAEEHPRIATVEDGHKVISDAIYKKSRRDWERDEKSFFQLANIVKVSEDKSEDLKQSLNILCTQLKRLLEKGVILEGLKLESKEKTLSLQVCKRDIEDKSKALRLSADTEKLHLEVLVRLEAAEARLKALSEACIRKEAQNLTLLEAVPVKLRQHDVLTDFLGTIIAQRDKAQADHKKAEENAQLCAQQLTSVVDQERSLKAAYGIRTDVYRAALKVFDKNLALQGFETEADFERCLMKGEAIIVLEETIIKYYQNKKVAEAQRDHFSRLINKQEMPVLEEYEKGVLRAEAKLQTVQQEHVQLLSRITMLKGTEQKYLEKMTAFDALDQECRVAQTLSDVANGQGDNQRKIRLVDWLLSSYFDDVLAQANLRFSKMTNFQFRLQRGLHKSKGRGVSGLDIEVYDEWSCASRPAVSLSGGESFLAALALALGLSDVVQQESGGIVLETIFIDEGFGHLDEDSLDHALNVLTELSEHNRSVGIISHVEEVKRRVPAGFTLISSSSGSRIEPRNVISLGS